MCVYIYIYIYSPYRTVNTLRLYYKNQSVHLMSMGPCIVIIFQYINPNKMHILHSLFYLTTALHVSDVTITHLQEHNTTVTTTSGNSYTVIDKVKFTDKEYRQIRLKLHLLLNNVYSAENAICSLFYRTYCIFRRIIIINDNCNCNPVYRYSLSVNLTLSITV